MKTTIEIPDQLYFKVKVLAAKTKRPVKDILIHALNTILEAEENPEYMIPIEKFYLNQSGWPILQSNSKKSVSDELINKIREKEGI
ncbi:MAG: antitoxin [Leptospiraceae bacterium]|nr:antitoxin [Leptospiraceae bacterium]